MRFVETVDKINGLPVGFKEVEYLESTGEQWIDTGVNAKTGLTVEARVKYTTTTGILCGAITTSAGNGDRFYAINFSQSNKVAFTYLDSNFSASTTLTNGSTYTIKTVIGATKQELFVDGVSKGSTSKTDIVDLNWTLGLFALHRGTQFTPEWFSEATSTVYNFKIWDNDTLVRDFIPCLDNNGKPCLYDLVGKKAYYNLGTGVDFNYGREIHPVEYLESSGTQYIDTGFKGKNNLHYKTKINFTALSTGGSNGIGGEYLGNASTYIGMVRANGHFTYLFNNTAVETTTTFYTDTDYVIDSIMNTGSQVVKVNGETISTGTLSGTFTSTRNIFLYAICSTNEAADVYGSLKMYYCQIYDNDILVRDFIPAIDENNVPFMFDKITHTAFLNAGTGTFLYGNPVASNKGKIRFPVTQHEKSRLPLGFKEVEYLQSTGTQWIDTGVYPTQFIEAEYSCAVTGSVSNVDSHLFGSRLSASSEAFDLAYMNTSPNGIEKFRFIHGTTTSQETTTSVTASQLTKPHTYYMSGTSFKIDGSEKISFTTASFTETYSLWLFGVNSAGSLHNQVRAQRVYKCKLWNNGVLVRDFIPCLDVSGKPCMYDLAGKKPYYNQGTGADFSYGREIHYVEYLESTGT